MTLAAVGMKVTRFRSSWFPVYMEESIYEWNSCKLLLTEIINLLFVKAGRLFRYTAVSAEKGYFTKNVTFSLFLSFFFSKVVPPVNVQRWTNRGGRLASSMHLYCLLDKIKNACIGNFKNFPLMLLLSSRGCLKLSSQKKFPVFDWLFLHGGQITVM